MDMEKIRETRSRRLRTQQEHCEKLFGQASRDCKHIVAVLIEQFNPRRIYQWGSLLHADHFRPWSDIDIAIEGLTDPLDGLRAMDVASDMTTFPVDIVELERIHPAHAETIRTEGRLVYERPSG